MIGQFGTILSNRLDRDWWRRLCIDIFVLVGLLLIDLFDNFFLFDYLFMFDNFFMIDDFFFLFDTFTPIDNAVQLDADLFVFDHFGRHCFDIRVVLLRSNLGPSRVNRIFFSGFHSIPTFEITVSNVFNAASIRSIARRRNGTVFMIHFGLVARQVHRKFRPRVQGHVGQQGQRVSSTVSTASAGGLGLFVATFRPEVFGRLHLQSVARALSSFHLG
jgi:hypothetical protein